MKIDGESAKGRLGCIRMILYCQVIIILQADVVVMFWDLISISILMNLQVDLQDTWRFSNWNECGL